MINITCKYYTIRQYSTGRTVQQNKREQNKERCLDRSIDRSIPPLPLSLRVSRVHTRDDERKTDELRLIPSVVASDTCERRVYTNTGWLGRVHREQNEFQRQVDGWYLPWVGGCVCVSLQVASLQEDGAFPRSYQNIVAPQRNWTVALDKYFPTKVLPLLSLSLSLRG